MNTPLHLAIQNGNIDIIKMLLADGCNLGERNAEGRTPLELATAMNNDEIVRLLLEHGAGHAAIPQAAQMAGILLDVPTRKKRISFWTIVCIIITVVLALYGITYETITLGIRAAASCPHNAQKAISAFTLFCGFFFFIPILVAYCIGYFFYVYRLWEEIPREFAQTTPGTAAWLSFIPFFHIYWMFVVFLGLYQDMNKATESYGHGKRFGTVLIGATCIFWLVIIIFSVVSAFVQVCVSDYTPPSPYQFFASFVSHVVSSLYCLFTTVMYWIIHKRVLEFMDIKASWGR
jgi:hypothetical protein